MVSFRNMGRCGNFLFQAAAALSYSLKHGLDFTVPTKTNDKYWNPLYLQHLAKPMLPKPQIIIKEQGHNYQELPFEESWRDKNIILEGYFQSEKYFKEYREEILKVFNFYWEQDAGMVSIHVRRGDYLQYPNKHPIIAADWIHRCMEKFYGFSFFVFSDDIQWCMDNIDGPELQFSTKSSEIRDLQLISCCEHHISSASTFSWWGCWFNQNPNKKIFIPELWFVPGHGGLDTSDIIPDSWIKIPN